MKVHYLNHFLIHDVAAPTSSEPSVSFGLVVMLIGTKPVASVIVAAVLSMETSDPEQLLYSEIKNIISAFSLNIYRFCGCF